MAEAVRDLLEAFYNVLYDTMFEAVALFMGEWGGRMEERERREEGPRESGEQVTSSGASGSIARGGA